MRQTPRYTVDDPDEVKRLIRENPWGTFVSHTDAGMVASHYPIVLEEDDPSDGGSGISIVSHFGRPDEVAHELGRHELLLIVQGPHGYISPGWYEEGDFIPTWNHVTAHLYGVPEVLDFETNYSVLEGLVARFEARMPQPRLLEIDEAYARRVSRGTVGLRLRVTRFDARLKLSQNKPAAVRETIMRELRGDGPFAQPALADEMARVAAESEHGE